MSEARKGAPKIALNMSMVKTIMWDKGPDYTFERVKAAGISYFELSQVDMTDAFIEQVLEASAKHGVTVMSTSLNYKPLFGTNAKGFDIERDMERTIIIIILNLRNLTARQVLSCWWKIRIRNWWDLKLMYTGFSVPAMIQ